MKRVRAIQIAASFLVAVMLLSSCTPIGKMQQNGWIKKLGRAFPEDTFTFEGHPQVLGVDYHDGNENDHFIVRNMDI